MLKKGSFPRWRLLAGTGVLVLVLLYLAVALWQRFQPPDPALLIDANLALQEHRPDDAFRLAQSYLKKAPNSAAGLYLAAQAADQRRRKDETLEILAEVSVDDASAEAVQCAILAGNICLEQGRAWDAEKHYRQALLHAPQDIIANRQMVFLLTVEGRLWESRPYLLELVSQRQNTPEELNLLSENSTVYDSRAELNRFLKARPQDPLPLLGLARREADLQETDKARGMLRQIIKVYPDLVEAHCWLGWTWVQDRQGASALAAWEAGLHPLPPNIQ